jgi:Fe-S cluster assembly protein SufD
VGADIITAEAAAGLDGPDWLRERRVAAVEALAGLPEPSTELEEWRYSRIDELDLGRFALQAPADVPTGGGIPTAAAIREELGDLDGVVVLLNGRVVECSLTDSARAAGVVLGTVGDGDPAVAAAGRSAIGAAAVRPADRYAALNDAYASDPVVLRVPRGVAVERPIAVLSLIDGNAAGTVVLTRLSVLADENSEVSVIEAAVSDDVDALAVPVTEISVRRAARVRHSSVQDLGHRVWQLGSFVGDVGQDATLSAAVAALGGDYARLRLDCTLSGRGATGNLASVYFGDGDQMLDLRTFQEHRAPDTTSNLLFKGAVADRSHSVYTGLIHISPEARGTNAFQTNRNLKLSDEAWAESVPNLEIENNDVHCSHASTVGPVDADQRFYLESRGVPTEVADRLVVAGFFDEVLDALPVPALAEPVRSRISGLLDRLVGSGAP